MTYNNLKISINRLFADDKKVITKIKTQNDTANGCMSEEGDVMSGVPQGTVLAAILFVIMISDIDEKVKNCILRSFADDTRVNKKVICNEDKELMQEDLEIIY